jgi:hypothetical protein
MKVMKGRKADAKMEKPGPATEEGAKESLPGRPFAGGGGCRTGETGERARGLGGEQRGEEMVRIDQNGGEGCIAPSQSGSDVHLARANWEH